MKRLKLVRLVATCLRPLLLWMLSLFFDKRYLIGKEFDTGFRGISWGLRAIWTRNILRLGAAYPCPVGLNCKISNFYNIDFHPDEISMFQQNGLYLQNFKAKIVFGHGSYIAPNVGIITSNHRLDNLDLHDDGEDVIIGENCWIGMNSVILPGVVLGRKTIIAAGSVVNSSFPDGHAVVGGAPARVLKRLD